MAIWLGSLINIPFPHTHNVSCLDSNTHQGLLTGSRQLGIKLSGLLMHYDALYSVILSRFHLGRFLLGLPKVQLICVH